MHVLHCEQTPLGLLKLKLIALAYSEALTNAVFGRAVPSDVLVKSFYAVRTAKAPAQHPVLILPFLDKEFA